MQHPLLALAARVDSSLVEPLRAQLLGRNVDPELDATLGSLGKAALNAIGRYELSEVAR